MNFGLTAASTKRGWLEICHSADDRENGRFGLSNARLDRMAE